MRYIKPTFWTLLLVALLACGITLEAHAQSLRSSEGVYIRQHFGLSSYLGDNEQSPFNLNLDAYEFNSKIPFTLGAELGYQVSSNFGVGVGYQLGDYPVVFQTADAINQYERINTLRHTAVLNGRYTVQGDVWRVAPYVEAGAFASYSSADRLTDNWAYGPSAGLGLDVALSNRTSLLMGWNTHISLNDMSIDQQNDQGFGDVDLLNAITLGLKHNFRSPFVAVDVFAIEGPAMLEVGEPGMFAATTNLESATPPLNYTWRFGDGSMSNGLVSAHAFEAPGTYTVTFTAVNDGSEDTETMLVTVVNPPVPAQINAINANPMVIDTETEVTFTADVLGDAPLAYSWSFGDGTTSTDVVPTHTFTEPGTYMVSLNLANEAGMDNEARTLTVTVYEPAFCATITEMNVVFFDRNSSVLTTQGEERLIDNAEVLAQCPTLDVMLTGMAGPDERGGEALAMDRARAVQDLYIAHGIAQDRIAADGNVAMGSTKVDGSQYRRVVTTPER